MEESMNSVENIRLHSLLIVLVEKGRDSIRFRGFVGSQLKDNGFSLPVCDRPV